MPCTTILVGRKATYDGSTMMARNEDSGPDAFMPKKWIIVRPEEQPRLYRSVLSGVEIELPADPLRYNAMPNADPRKGIWGEAGFNACNVAMSETETITSNARVLGADPMVKNGIGEEDMLTVTLPYIRSAREGVKRLGGLLEKYGTYEMNGVGFQDRDEIWWLESVGGHHWMARRVPDDCYAVGPNQQGIDVFDFTDAYGEGKDFLCDPDLADFIDRHHLDLSVKKLPAREQKRFDVRAALGSHTDKDHTYNTPRAWIMEKTLSPSARDRNGLPYAPDSDDLPWCLAPEKRITVEDVKTVLSSCYEGTPYDPYSVRSDERLRGKLRPIGINRNNFVMLTHLRPGLPEPLAAVEWIAVGSNKFNSFVPFYACVNDTPDYLKQTGVRVTSESFYWENRLIAALADAHFGRCLPEIERYQLKLAALGQRLILETDEAFLAERPADPEAFLEERNRRAADLAREMTDELLDRVLFIASQGMKNAFARGEN